MVLTKDKRIRRRRLERDALFEANVAAFVITSKSLRGEEIANIFIKAKNRMIKILTKHPKPFIAAVTRDGKVKLIVEADAFQ